MNGFGICINLVRYFVYSQLLRVQSPEGTKRVEVSPSASIRDLYETIHDAFQLNDFGFGVYRERNFSNEVCE